MSKFSDSLNNILKANDISVYSLSKCSGVARTSIYKYLNGKTLPKKEFLDSIIDILCLSTKQKKELCESYKKEVYGEEVYLSLTKFKQFIENLNQNFYNGEIKFMCSSFDLDKKVEFLDCLASVQFYLRKIIENEMSKKDIKPTIYMIVQPNCKYLFDLLYSYAKHKNISMEINQIISFEKRYEGKFCTADNIDVLSKLLVAAIFNQNINYNLNYYYENSVQENNFNKVFPYFMIADNQILFISHDYETGLYIKDESLYEHFKSEFNRILKWSSKFVRFNRGIIDLVKFFKEVDDKNLNYSYVLGFQPCFSAFYTPEMVSRKIDRTNPIFEKIGEYIADRFARSKDIIQEKAIVSYFTLEGLDYFCKEGRIVEFPNDMNVVFDKDEILYLLRCLYNAIKNNQIEAYIINTDSFKVPVNTVIASYELDYINILYNDVTNDSITATIIHEKGMTEIINYFFEDLKTTDDVYGIERSLEEIGKRIEMIEQELNRI